jgi:hypothetical protein
MRKKKRFYARPFGFMSIQCEKCGDIRGFNSREVLEYSRCRECDHKTFLTDLAPAVLHCKCGVMSVISTNMTDAIITITCPFCKAPVDLELDRDGRGYETLEDEV